jgi:hypothetical protein
MDVMENNGETVRGMVVGSQAVVKRRTPCGVILGTPVDWVWSAHILGFDPTVIYFWQHNR